jgi:hypothetical protein
MVVSISTAGFDRDSIAWQVYERGRELARQGEDAMRQERFLFRWFAADVDAAVGDPEGWERPTRRRGTRVPAAAHEHVGGLDRELGVRLRLGRLQGPGGTRRSAGVVDRHRHRREARQLRNRRGRWVGDKLHARSTVMTPSPGRPIAVADVREQVGRMGGDRLAEVVYDPNSFRESAQELEERGLPMIEFPPNHARIRTRSAGSTARSSGRWRRSARRPTSMTSRGSATATTCCSRTGRELT